MIARGQDKKAQATRLALGCCPTHGLFMPQYTPWLSRDEAAGFGFIGPEGSVCVVRCPRKDCQTYALARGPDQIVKVLGPSESTTVEEMELKAMRQSHAFAQLVKAELRAKRSKNLTPDESVQCYELSHRKPS